VIDETEKRGLVSIKESFACEVLLAGFYDMHRGWANYRGNWCSYRSSTPSIVLVYATRVERPAPDRQGNHRPMEEAVIALAGAWLTW